MKLRVRHKRRCTEPERNCGGNGKGEKSVNAKEMKEKRNGKKKENDKWERIIEPEAVLEDMCSVCAHTLTGERRCCT